MIDTVHPPVMIQGETKTLQSNPDKRCYFLLTLANLFYDTERLEILMGQQSLKVEEMSNLPAVDDFLVEDTKFIANTVAIGGQTQ